MVILSTSQFAKRHAVEGSRSRIWLLVRKEIAGNIRSYKLPFAFAVMVLLFPLSAHLLMIDYKQRLDDWTINQAVQRSPLVGGMVKYSLSDGTFSHVVGEAPDPPIQHPQSLSVLVKGMDAELERSVSVSQRIAFGLPSDENPISNLFDSPDINFLVKTVVSLFALFFSVDMITREKEAGTLRALFANPLSRRELVLSKAMGASASLFICLVAGLLSNLLYLYSADIVFGNKEDLARVLLLFGMSLLYGMVFVLLGLFVSTISVRTKIAVTKALLAWGATVLVLPNAAVLAAMVFYPVPSYNQFNALMREEQDRIVKEMLSDHPGAKTIFEIPNAKEAAFRIMEADRVLTDDYLAGKLKQVERAERLAIFSPAGALTFGSTDLAGTGASAYRSYLEFLRTGRDQVVDALKRQWDLPAREGGMLVGETLDLISSRQYQREPLSTSLLSAVPSLASLSAWAGVLIIAVMRRFEKYDVS